MNKTLARKPFVTEKDGANPGRFDKNDFYDKSTYLSTMPRQKQILPFNRITGRNSELIDKAGNQLVELNGKSAVFYDSDAKLKTMNRLEKSVPAMNRTTKRVGYQSIYKREAVPDHYDSNAVAKT